jgi:hypothetical protein
VTPNHLDAATTILDAEVVALARTLEVKDRKAWTSEVQTLPLLDLLREVVILRSRLAQRFVQKMDASPQSEEAP